MSAALRVAPVLLSAEDEERAARLHRDSTVFLVHDHCIEEGAIHRMLVGGVTAKQLHLSVDVRLWGTPELFRATVATSTASLDAAADPGRSDGFLKSALIALDHVRQTVARSDGLISIALEPEDVVAAKAKGGLALLLGAEGARLTEYRLEVLRAWVDLGLRHLQLSWAVDHPLGANQTDTSGRGLTDFGRDFIRELNRLGVIVDVSHLSYQSIVDSVDASAVPVLNGHSGALALNDTQPQLMPDDVIRAIADKGGVVAVHFMSQMVKPGRDKASFDDLMRQFVYLVDLVGADHVACGPDYLPEPSVISANQGISEPFTYADGVEDIGMMANVTRGLVSRGFSDPQIAAMIGGNLLRLFTVARNGRATGAAASDPTGPSSPGEHTGGLTSV